MRRLLREMRCRGSLALAATCGLAQSGVGLAVPALAGSLAAALFVGAEAALAARAAELLALLLAQAALVFGGSYAAARVSSRAAAVLRGRLHERLHTVPLAFYHGRSSADVAAQGVADTELLSAFLGGAALGVLPAAVGGLGAVCLMARIDPRLAALAVCSVPVAVLALRGSARSLRVLSTVLAERQAELFGRLIESLGMLPVVKAFGREAHETARHRVGLDEATRLADAQRRRQLAVGPITEAVAALGAVGLLVLGTEGLGSRTHAPAALVSFLLYALLAARSAGALARAFAQAQEARPALARLRALEQEPPEQGGVRRLGRACGAIEFEDVHFAYPGGSPALEAVQLRVEPGERIALVGPNGGGKTTLLALLLALWRPQRGRITLDGIDLADLDLASLRRQFGYVPQEGRLLCGSVRENLAFAEPHAEPAVLARATRHAGADRLVASLPRGFETRIGEGGSRLSGGQRQRLALARALLPDRPVLLLDEPLSMLDAGAERAFLRRADRVFANRTVIWVTHRAPSPRLIDRVVHLDRRIRGERGVWCGRRASGETRTVGAIPRG